MKDKDFKMLMEAYFIVSKKKMLKESYSPASYYTGDNEDPNIFTIEIRGKHFRYEAEFALEASDWTADEHDDYGYDGPYTSYGKAYPQNIEIQGVYGLNLYSPDQPDTPVFEYDTKKVISNNTGLPEQEILKAVFDDFHKKIDDSSTGIYDEIKDKTEPPEWEP